jgi:hypothetical protein
MQHPIRVGVAFKDAGQLSVVANIELRKLQGALRAKPLQVFRNAVTTQTVDDNYLMAAF